MSRFVARAMLVVTMFVVSTGAVLANSSTYSWTNDHVVVDGKANGVFHGLDAGANANPFNVRFQTFKSGFPWDTIACDKTVTPPRTLNTTTSWNFNCNTNVQSGTFYLYIWKATGTDDGWNQKGYGTLATK
jgi:hypothetical protein